MARSYTRWDKDDPQGRGGRFAPKDRPDTGVAPGGKAAGKPGIQPGVSLPAALARHLATAPVDELLEAFGVLSQQKASAGRDEALLVLDAELARREGTPGLTVVDDHPSHRQLDDLIARGYSYVEAYAEVHHLDEDKLTRQERHQLVDAERRPGERRAETIRRMYAERVAIQWAQAEDDTHGNLLSAAGRAAGIRAESLWSGTSARARKYASDELKQWWSEHGGRVTAGEFRAQFTGDRAAAQKARMSGQGKDYGI